MYCTYIENSVCGENELKSLTLDAFVKNFSGDCVGEYPKNTYVT